MDEDELLENGISDYINAELKAQAEEKRSELNNSTSTENSSIQQNTEQIEKNTNAQQRNNEQVEKAIESLEKIQSLYGKIKNFEGLNVTEKVSLFQDFENSFSEFENELNEENKKIQDLIKKGYIPSLRAGEKYNQKGEVDLNYTKTGGHIVTEDYGRGGKVNLVSGGWWSPGINKSAIEQSQDFMGSDRMMVKGYADLSKLVTIKHNEGKQWYDLLNVGEEGSEGYKEALDLIKEFKSIRAWQKQMKDSLSDEDFSDLKNTDKWSSKKNRLMEISERMNDINHDLNDPRSFPDRYNYNRLLQDYNPKITDAISHVYQQVLGQKGVYYPGIEDGSGPVGQFSVKNENIDEVVHNVVKIEKEYGDTLVSLTEKLQTNLKNGNPLSSSINAPIIEELKALTKPDVSELKDENVLTWNKNTVQQIYERAMSSSVNSSNNSAIEGTEVFKAVISNYVDAFKQKLEEKLNLPKRLYEDFKLGYGDTLSNYNENTKEGTFLTKDRLKDSYDTILSLYGANRQSEEPKYFDSSLSDLENDIEILKNVFEKVKNLEQYSDADFESKVLGAATDVDFDTSLNTDMISWAEDILDNLSSSDEIVEAIKNKFTELLNVVTSQVKYMQSTGQQLLSGSVIVSPGLEKIQKVNDLILTKNGQAFITDNADNLIATKDLGNLGSTQQRLRYKEDKSTIIGMLSREDAKTLISLTEALNGFGKNNKGIEESIKSLLKTSKEERKNFIKEDVSFKGTKGLLNEFMSYENTISSWGKSTLGPSPEESYIQSEYEATKAKILEQVTALNELQNSIQELNEKVYAENTTESERIKYTEELDSNTENYKNTLNELNNVLKTANKETSNAIYENNKLNADSGYSNRKASIDAKYAWKRDKQQTNLLLNEGYINEYNTTGYFKDSLKKTLFNKATGLRQRSGLTGFAANLGYNVSGVGASIGFGIFGKALSEATKAVFNFAKESVAAYGELQSIKTNLGIVYGSQTEANQTFDEIAQYSIKSPFGVQTVSEYAVLLKQSGIYASDLMDTLKQIGDVAGGNQQKFGNIANAFSQIEANGKATTRQLREFATAGIPIYAELSKQLGIGVDRIRKMTEEGQITSDIIEQTFKNMTSEGGMFENAVNIGAKTWKARQQNLADQKQLAQAELGELIVSIGGTGRGDSFAEEILGSLENFYGFVQDLARLKNIENNVDNISTNLVDVKKLQEQYDEYYEKANKDSIITPEEQAVLSKLEAQIKAAQGYSSPDQIRAADLSYFKVKMAGDYYDTDKMVRKATIDNDLYYAIELLNGSLENAIWAKGVDATYDLDGLGNTLGISVEDFRNLVKEELPEFADAIFSNMASTMSAATEYIVSNYGAKTIDYKATKKDPELEERILNSTYTAWNELRLSKIFEEAQKSNDKEKSIYKYNQKREEIYANSDEGKLEADKKAEQEWNDARAAQREYLTLLDEVKKDINGQEDVFIKLKENVRTTLTDFNKMLDIGMLEPIDRIYTTAENMAINWENLKFLPPEEKQKEIDRRSAEWISYGERLSSFYTAVSDDLPEFIKTATEDFMNSIYSSYDDGKFNNIIKNDVEGITKFNIALQQLYDTLNNGLLRGWVSATDIDSFTKAFQSNAVKYKAVADIGPYQSQVKSSSSKDTYPLWQRILNQTLGVDLALFKNKGVVNGKQAFDIFNQQSQRDTFKNVFREMLNTKSLADSTKIIAYDNVLTPAGNSSNLGRQKINYEKTYKNLELFAIGLDSSAKETRAFSDSLKQQIDAVNDFYAEAVTITENAENIYDPAYQKYLEKLYKNIEATGTNAFDLGFKRLSDGSLIFEEMSVEAAEKWKQENLVLQEGISALADFKEGLIAAKEETKNLANELKVSSGLYNAGFMANLSKEGQQKVNDSMRQILDRKEYENLSGYISADDILNFLANSSDVEEVKSRISTKIGFTKEDLGLENDVIKEEFNKRYQAAIDKFSKYDADLIAVQEGIIKNKAAYSQDWKNVTYNKTTQAQRNELWDIVKKDPRYNNLRDKWQTAYNEKEALKADLTDIDENKDTKNKLEEILETLTNLYTEVKEGIDEIHIQENIQKGLTYRNATNDVREDSSRMHSFLLNSDLANGNKISQQWIANELGLTDLNTSLSDFYKSSFLDQNGKFDYELVKKQFNMIERERERKSLRNPFEREKYKARNFDNYMANITVDKDGNEIRTDFNKQTELEQQTRLESVVDNMKNDSNKITLADIMDTKITQELDDLSKSIKDTFNSSLFQGISDSFKLMGKYINDMATASDEIGAAWKSIGASLLGSIGAQMTQTGLTIAAQAAIAGKWGEVGPALALAGVGAMASFASGLMEDDKSKENDRENRLKNLKDLLADLIEQAKTDAEYYEKNLLHETAIDRGYDVSTMSVNDAIITPSGNVITTHPDDYLIATKTPNQLIGNNSTSTINVKIVGDNGESVKVVRTEQKRRANGEIDIKAVIVANVKEAIAGGELDDAFSAREYRQAGRSYAM